jgi:peroxiredoxin
MPPTPARASSFRLDSKRIAALGVVLAASALLVGYFVWMVQPAAAHEAIAACNGLKANPKNPALGAIPRPAPDFTTTCVVNNKIEQHKLSDFRGKVVLLHYWASWCGACEQEKPSLMHMADEMTGPEFQVIALASDLNWKAVTHSLPEAPFIVCLDPPDEEGSIGPISQSWGTHAVPESFLIDRSGRIRMYFDNRRDWDSPVAETCIQSIIDE